MSKRRTLRAILVAVTVSLLVPGPVAAVHTLPCDDFRPETRIEGDNVAGNKQGARAILQGESLGLCTNPDGDDVSGSWVLVNVEGPLPDDVGFSIVQVGLGRCVQPNNANCNGAMSYYWAWGRNADHPGCAGKLDKAPAAIRLGAWEGVSRTYYVTHTGGFWKAFINFVERASVAQGEVCWTPAFGSWFGENKDFGDAIGGLAGNKFGLSSLRVQNAQNGAWVNPSISDPCAYNAVAPFRCDVTAGDAMNLWTDDR
jgi:hypothetical protein